jgi:hypothetical protein
VELCCYENIKVKDCVNKFVSQVNGHGILWRIKPLIINEECIFFHYFGLLYLSFCLSYYRSFTYIVLFFLAFISFSVGLSFSFFPLSNTVPQFPRLAPYFALRRPRSRVGYWNHESQRRNWNINASVSASFIDYLRVMGCCWDLRPRHGQCSF